MIKGILLVILIFLAACGYQPANKKKFLDYKFYELDLKGDQIINDKIIKTLNIKQNNEEKLFKKLSIKSSKNIQQASKNSKGQIETYRLILDVEVSITRDNKIIKKQNFSENFTYSDKSSKFLLEQHQVEIENKVLNKIITDIKFFLNY